MAHFVFQDADEDGVGNSVDACSDTEKGVNLDEKGCLLPLYSDDLFLDPNGVTSKQKKMPSWEPIIALIQRFIG